MTRNVKKLLASALALLVAITLALGLCACAGETASEKPSSSAQQAEEKISVTVLVVDKDGNTETFNLKTNKTSLADALVEEGIIEYASDGFYTTVNGITADFSKDGGWWCVTKDGKMTTKGMNDLKLADGDKYEITYTIG